MQAAISRPSNPAPAAFPGRMGVAILCAVLLAAGCASDTTQHATASASYPPKPVASVLPPDATYVVEKLAACTHFADEFGGDNSQRDREYTAAIVQLRCETIDEDVRAIVAKYAGNKIVLKALKDASSSNQQ